MRKGLVVLLTTLSIITVGCGDEAESQRTDPMTQPVQYKNNSNNSGRETDNNWNRTQMPLSAPQNDDAKQNAASYGDSGEIKLANKIRNEIKDIPGIHDVQTTVTDKTVHVALDTEDEFRGNPNLLNKVRSRVQQLVGERDLRIYTDGAYFDRMRNMSTNPEMRFEP
ncbi:YhcN/YlaJ family sporulation lipoprotein [Salirhabdus sp. Marseille-P4669]|uniref:YhcN/YlaJ family sporulation lipoprotein n=1 Tax=Salirhabdus sp. Marseille-P4669 TaxID=2042310 RepID=UPI001359676D|nr:YhcN/YlaJ family sporulation lipoprotein [Salirhabdus sp. Marseille-P4669]